MCQTKETSCLFDWLSLHWFAKLDLFNVCKTGSAFEKQTVKSLCQKRKEKNYNHINRHRKSICQNPTPYSWFLKERKEKKTLANSKLGELPSLGEDIYKSL